VRSGSGKERVIAPDREPETLERVKHDNGRGNGEEMQSVRSSLGLIFRAVDRQP